MTATAAADEAPAPSRSEAPEAPSLRSRVGLNAANFFLAEITGVVVPFLAVFLAGRGWRDDAIGVAVAAGGLGVFLAQTPAGVVVDRVRRRRTLLAAASLALGVCYGLLPLLPAHWSVVDPLLFLAGAAQAFFLPLLGALALALVGHAGLCRTMGQNQGGTTPATWPPPAWRWGWSRGSGCRQSFMRWRSCPSWPPGPCSSCGRAS